MTCPTRREVERLVAMCRRETALTDAQARSIAAHAETLRVVGLVLARKAGIPARIAELKRNVGAS